MSTNDPFSNPWSQAWLEQQRNYWETWSDLGRRAMGMAEPPKPAWESALDHWWQAVGSAVPGESRPLFNHLLEQGRQLLRVSDEWNRQLQEGDWQQAAVKSLNTLSESIARATATPAAGDWSRGVTEPWQAWQRWGESLPGWLSPDALTSSLSSLHPGSMTIPGGDALLQQLLTAPGVGYFREHEGQYKQLLLRFDQLRQALSDYSSCFADLTGEANSQLREQLLASDAKPVEGARDLYNRWVDQCERIYAERVMTSDYQALHGRLVNAQMALRHDLQQMMEPWLHSLNISTTTDLAPLQQRLQEVRRRERQQANRIRSMEQRIDALERQLGELAARPLPATPAASESDEKPATAAASVTPAPSASRSTKTRSATATTRRKSSRKAAPESGKE